MAERECYEYKEGIVMPPGNFPSGCDPIFVDLFEDAVKEARKQTNEGILVIVDYHDDLKEYCDVLDQLNENRKGYCKLKNDFKKGGDPYKFLLDGNVLLINEFASFGFEWATVINTFTRGWTKNATTMHDCNYMLRCTTNLIMINRKEERDSDDTDGYEQGEAEVKRRTFAFVDSRYSVNGCNVDIAW